MSTHSHSQLVIYMSPLKALAASHSCLKGNAHIIGGEAPFILIKVAQ